MLEKGNFRICALDSENLNSERLDSQSLDFQNLDSEKLNSQNFCTAFSSLELVIVLCLFGILGLWSVREINLNLTQACIQNLRAQFLGAQDAISRIYLEEFLTRGEITDFSSFGAQDVLKNLQTQSHAASTKCNFSYTHPILSARIYSQNLDFEIQPTDLKINPKIFCNQDDELCRRFFNRLLDK